MTSIPGQEGVAPGWGLVLGGGGAIGTAYVAGVLRALEETGLDPRTAGLVVGTSAGAAVGARIRLGDTAEQVLALADAAPREPASSGAEHYERAWTTRTELVRRTVGSGGVVARSLLRAPLPLPSQWVAEQFPAGLFRVRDQARFASLFPPTWPDRPLWLVAFDLRKRRRTALGSRPQHLDLPLGSAVMASCAVPGFYPPVTMNGTMYVDGGVTSTTHLDLAIRHGCRRVICIAPLGYTPSTARVPARQRMLRRVAVRGIRRELSRIGARALDVLVVQPAADDLALHGSNLLRGSGNDGVAERAYEQTLFLLTSAPAGRFLDEAAASGETGGAP
jgi:NTE family protein